MSTKFAWIIPSFYQTPSESVLAFDTVAHTHNLLNNRVWERKFQYGHIYTLEKLPISDVLHSKIIVTPLKARAKYIASEVNQYPEFIKGYLDDVFGISNIFNITGDDDYQTRAQKANLLAGRNWVIIEGEINKDITIENQDFVEDWQRLIGLAEELGALFRAALQLFFVTHWGISPTLARPENQNPGGLFIIRSGSAVYMEPILTSEFMFPNTFVEEHISAFETFFRELSEIWHLSLWPIHRYLRALNAQFVEMEKILDLLFALEGIFEKDTSSRLIRVAVATMTSTDRLQALKTSAILDKAFYLRNEIVHGGKYFTGIETIQLAGKDVQTQQIFWETKRIVSAMIQVAIKKLQAFRKIRSSKNAANLHISTQDIIEHYYLKSENTK